MLIRPAANEDSNAIWAIMEPIIQAGETYALPRDMGKDSALAYWLSAEREVFIAEDNGHIVGTYGLQANQKGGGAHVANCSYMTAYGCGRALASRWLGASAVPSCIRPRDMSTPTSCIAIFSAVCADTRGYATHAACLILPLPSNDSSMS